MKMTSVMTRGFSSDSVSWRVNIARLLDHDAGEARFRAALIAGLARTRDLSGVATLAADLERRLT
jgi:hypothetical protein